MALIEIIHLLPFLCIYAFFIHQMRYTYQTRSYSFLSCIDSCLTTAVLILVQYPWFQALVLLSELFHRSIYDNYATYSPTFSFIFFFTMTIIRFVGQIMISKIRYQQLPVVRIIIYILLPFILFTALDYFYKVPVVLPKILI